MRISFFTFLVLMILSINIDAQNSEIQARAKYQKAIEEYGSGNYADCITSAKSCIQLLGESKPRIERLLAKSYFSIEDLDQSRKHIKNYFNIAAENDADYDEMVTLLATIDQFEKKKAEEKRETESWEKAKKLNKVYGYYEYLMKYPYGEHKKDAEFQLDLKRKEIYIQDYLELNNKRIFEIVNINKRDGNYCHFEFSFSGKTVTLIETVTTIPFSIYNHIYVHKMPKRKKVSRDEYIGNLRINNDNLYLSFPRLGEFEVKLANSSPKEYELRFVSYPESRSIYRGLKLKDGLPGTWPGLTDEYIYIKEINDLLASKDYEKITTSIQAFINFFPESDQLSTLYSELGLAYCQLYISEMEMNSESAKANSLFNASKKYYKTFLESEENSFAALFGLGYLYYNRGFYFNPEENFSTALNYFLEAEKIEPTNRNTLLALREIYKWRNDVEKTNYYKSKLDSLD